MIEHSYNIKIKNIENNGCSDTEVRFLVNLFTDTVEHMVSTLARESWYRLEDFADSETYGVEEFILLITRKTICKHTEWKGIFRYDRRSLKVCVTLVLDVNSAE